MAPWTNNSMPSHEVGGWGVRRRLRLLGCGAALHRRTRSIEAEEASGAHGGAFGWLARVAELRFSGCGGGGARRVSVADAAVSERKRESCRAHASRSRCGPWWRPGQGECGRRAGHRPPTVVSRIAHTQRSRCTIAAWNQRVDCVRPSLTLRTFLCGEIGVSRARRCVPVMCRAPMSGVRVRRHSCKRHCARVFFRLFP